ncbi:hypothetical protein V6N13_122738 [Hibiscus sabdariffa]
MGDFRVKEGANSGEGFRQKHTQTTVFVSNLPPRLHWQGLWFAFARHGEVVDAFIPARKSKKGHRFGFVRFTTLKEAEKAIAQMNGCVLYGSRLAVRLAKFLDNLEDRLYKQLKFRVSKTGESSKNQSKYFDDMSRSPRDSLKNPCLKRILGHVEEEAIKKLKRCFIGKTATRCSTSQVTGVPPHCWNLTTFKRLVDSWGSLLSLGENANQRFDCEKVTMLISTQKEETINETIELEVGRDCFLVQVVEIGMGFPLKQSVTIEQFSSKKSVNTSPESSASPFSKNCIVSKNGNRLNCIGEDEVTKAICL